MGRFSREKSTHNVRHIGLVYLHLQNAAAGLDARYIGGAKAGRMSCAKNAPCQQGKREEEVHAGTAHRAPCTLISDKALTVLATNFLRRYDERRMGGDPFNDGGRQG